jgi:multiple sugar transport system permease protein
MKSTPDHFEMLRQRRTDLGETLWAYALSAPALFLMLVLLLLPVLAVIAIAQTDWEFATDQLRYVGLSNFTALLTDNDFRAALLNTCVYVLIVVPVTIVLALVIALLIESGESLQSFYRAVHFLPFMATLAAMAIVWEALLHPTVGVVNHLMTAIGLPTANWLRDRNTVLATLAAIGIWKQVGYAMVLFIAGLKTIPQELYDAADVDGADSVLDRLRTVTLPLLGPVTMFVTIVTAIKALQVFDTVRVLTGGGPNNASNVLLNNLYVESFEYLHAGYGAAISVVFLVIVVALTLLQARVFDKRVHYT